MLTDILMPTILLCLISFGVPTLLGKILPQNFLGLIINACLSVGSMIILCAVYMWGTWNLIDTQELSSGMFLLALQRGFSAFLIWGPILVLALIVQPQKWKPKL